MFVEFFHLAEVLQMKFEHAEWQGWGNSEGRLSLELLSFVHVFFSILAKNLSVYIYISKKERGLSVLEP